MWFGMQSLKHNPNGRFVVVCGDGEYIIYTALAWRNRSFGSALEFVWLTDILFPRIPTLLRVHRTIKVLIFM
jgi:coatomer subunit beta'